MVLFIRFSQIILFVSFLSNCSSSQSHENNHSFVADSGSYILLPAKKIEGDYYQIIKFDQKLVVYGLPYVEIDKEVVVGDFKILIISKNFGESHIEIADTNLVAPKLSDQERASAEYLKVKQIVKGKSKQIVGNFDFIPPIDSVITSKFGKRRFINGTPRSPHMALDLRGAVGTEIYAPMAGSVVMAETHFYGGNKIILDHGGGLFTAYSHLDQFNVEEGEFVEQGAVIGLVGMTGRVTGPHLHWEVYLNEERINPELLIDLEYAQD